MHQPHSPCSCNSYHCQKSKVKAIWESDGEMNEWVDGWMDGWTDGYMDGWMSRWVDGWVDEQMDRWIFECCLYTIQFTHNFLTLVLWSLIFLPLPIAPAVVTEHDTKFCHPTLSLEYTSHNCFNTNFFFNQNKHVTRIIYLLHSTEWSEELTINQKTQAV